MNHGHTGHVRFLTSVQMGGVGTEDSGRVGPQEEGGAGTGEKSATANKGDVEHKGETLNNDKGTG